MVRVDGSSAQRHGAQLDLPELQEGLSPTTFKRIQEERVEGILVSAGLFEFEEQSNSYPLKLSDFNNRKSNRRGSWRRVEDAAFIVPSPSTSRRPLYTLCHLTIPVINLIEIQT